MYIIAFGYEKSNPVQDWIIDLSNGGGQNFILQAWLAGEKIMLLQYCPKYVSAKTK